MFLLCFHTSCTIFFPILIKCKFWQNLAKKGNQESVKLLEKKHSMDKFIALYDTNQDPQYSFEIIHLTYVKHTLAKISSLAWLNSRKVDKMRTRFDRKSSSQSNFGRPCRSSQIISSRTEGVAAAHTAWFLQLRLTLKKSTLHKKIHPPGLWIS